MKKRVNARGEIWGRRERSVNPLLAVFGVLLLAALLPASLGPGGAGVSASEVIAAEAPASPDGKGKVRALGTFDSSSTNGTVGKSSFVGADSYFVPLSPFRMYDSRLEDGFWLQGDDFLLDALSDQFGNPVVPADATAVAFNVTVAQTGSAGFVQIYGPGTAAFETSTVNWSFGGISIANSGVSMLGDFNGVPGLMGVALGGLFDASAFVIIDITGYYVPFTG